MKPYLLIFVICFIIASGGQACETFCFANAAWSNPVQDTVSRNWSNNNIRTYSRDGKLYVQLGLNWSHYGRSDINFEGPGYDFTLENVAGKDQPYESSLQYNIHVGYHITDRYSISLGFDHMKYVMKSSQRLIISGVIEPQVSNPVYSSGPFAGNYSSQPIRVTPEMLTLKYTDGFNYVSAHVQRLDDVWLSDDAKTLLALETGLGLGLMVPRSDVRLFGVGKNNKANIAGWSASGKAGLMLNFNKKLYLLGSLEAGYANMDKIFTTGRNDFDKASQNINYVQNTYLIGFRF